MIRNKKIVRLKLKKNKSNKLKSMNPKLLLMKLNMNQFGRLNGVPLKWKLHLLCFFCLKRILRVREIIDDRPTHKEIVF